MTASHAGQHPTLSPGALEMVDSGASLHFLRFLRRVFGRPCPAVTIGRLLDGSK